MENGSYDATPRAPLPILHRLELGRLAVVSTVLEIAAAVVAISEHEPGFVAVGTVVAAALVGGATFDAHNHHVNGYPRKFALVKERSWPNRMG